MTGNLDTLRVANSAGRSQIAPLSSEEEELLINRKLEQAAFHYNQQLAWQLHHMRSLYQSRLQLIQQSVQLPQNEAAAEGAEPPSGNITQQRSSSNNAVNTAYPSNGSTTSWRRHLLSSLQNEKAKLLRLTEAARERLQRGTKELDVLQELSRSLSFNEGHWEEKAKEAAAKLAMSEAAQRCVRIN